MTTYLLLLLIILALALIIALMAWSLAARPVREIIKEVPAKPRRRKNSGPVDLDELAEQIELRSGFTTDVNRAYQLSYMFAREVELAVAADGLVYFQFKDVVDQARLAQRVDDLLKAGETVKG